MRLSFMKVTYEQTSFKILISNGWILLNLQDVSCLERGCNNEVLSDPMALDALRGCGFLKFFRMSNMKNQTQLLEMFVHYWDP